MASNYDYVINTDTISSIQDTLSMCKSEVATAVGSFKRNASSSLAKLNNISSSIASDAGKIENAISKLDSALIEYNENVNLLEANLSNFNVEGLDSPIDFIGNPETGTFTKNVDDALMPVLNGEKNNNLDLGFIHRNAEYLDAFKEKRRNGLDTGTECVTLVTKYVKEYGVECWGNASDLWTEYYGKDPNGVKSNGERYTEKEKLYMENFTFIEHPTTADLQPGDIIIWEGGSRFVPKDNQYAPYGHSAIWDGEKIFGQHQHGEYRNLSELVPDDWDANKSTINGNVGAIHIIRPKKVD